MGPNMDRSMARNQPIFGSAADRGGRRQIVAAAMAHDAPLLFKGRDFLHTDVKRAEAGQVS
jgi:hypothetical protein